MPAARPHPLRRLAARWPMLAKLAGQLGIAGLALIGCAAVFWHIEPTTPRFADALWLTFATASTVGYGDVIPTTPLSRAFAGVVLLIGFGVLSLVTAAIAATWFESQERRFERELLRNVHRELANVRDELTMLRNEMNALRRETRAGPESTPPPAA